MSVNAWVTLATNDSYGLGALVLGHSLRQTGTPHQLVVLITPGVTQPMRDTLKNVFNDVHEVNILDSKDEANLKLLSRPELGVTFTKLHCWRLTQYQKCVFLDADTMVLQNADELFDREELSAAPDVGWPDCFNSGVFVFVPSNDTYNNLIDFALSKGSFDGGDQGLLNMYFSDWAHKDINKHLPFIYNMCSTACYSYLPAFKQFGSNVKIIHFIAQTKPWLQFFDPETRQVKPTQDLTHLTGLLQHWWNIFCSVIHPQLTKEMGGFAGAFARLTLGEPRSEEQSVLENTLRRQGWEIGNIDYMNKDSFGNIWNKICETLATGPDSGNGKSKDIKESNDDSNKQEISKNEIPVGSTESPKLDPVTTPIIYSEQIAEKTHSAEIKKDEKVTQENKDTTKEVTVTSTGAAETSNVEQKIETFSQVTVSLNEELKTNETSQVLVSPTNETELVKTDEQTETAKSETKTSDEKTETSPHVSVSSTSESQTLKQEEKSERAPDTAAHETALNKPEVSVKTETPQPIETLEEKVKDIISESAEPESVEKIEKKITESNVSPPSDEVAIIGEIVTDKKEMTEITALKAEITTTKNEEKVSSEEQKDPQPNTESEMIQKDTSNLLVTTDATVIEKSVQKVEEGTPVTETSTTNTETDTAVEKTEKSEEKQSEIETTGNVSEGAQGQEASELPASKKKEVKSQKEKPSGSNKKSTKPKK